MSRIDQAEIKCPAEKYFEWSGDIGQFSYFDKSLADANNPKGKNVNLPLPFEFMVLEIMCCVAGWDKQGNSRIYSNDVINQKEQVLNVRSFKDDRKIAVGLWQDIEKDVKAEGGEFAKTIFIAYKEGKELKIGHIRIKSAVLTEWIEFGKTHNFYKAAMIVRKAAPRQKGNINYFVPVFEQKEISAATEEKAKKLTIKLVEYIRFYLKNTQPTYTTIPPSAPANTKLDKEEPF